MEEILSKGLDIKNNRNDRYAYIIRCCLDKIMSFSNETPIDEKLYELEDYINEYVELD